MCNEPLRRRLFVGLGSKLLVSSGCRNGKSKIRSFWCPPRKAVRRSELFEHHGGPHGSGLQFTIDQVPFNNSKSPTNHYPARCKRLRNDINLRKRTDKARVVHLARLYCSHLSSKYARSNQRDATICTMAAMHHQQANNNPSRYTPFNAWFFISSKGGRVSLLFPIRPGTGKWCASAR
jgi:hypothetical protein